MDYLYALKKRVQKLQKKGFSLAVALLVCCSLQAQQWSYAGSETGISGGGSSFLNLVKGTGNNVYLSYYDLSVTKGSVQKYDGTNWSYLGGSPGITTGAATFSSLSADAAGNVYYTNQNSGMEVRKFDGTSWAQLPKFATNTINYQASAVAINGTIVAANNENALTVKRYINGAWEQLGTTGIAGVSPSFIKMIAGPDNKIYVSFHSNGYVHVYQNAVTASSTTAWTPVGDANVGTASASENYNSSLAIDASGNLYLAYASGSAAGNKLNVKKFNGTAWVTMGTENFSPGKVQHVALAVTAAGVPYVAASNWEDADFLKNYMYGYDAATSSFVQLHSGYLSSGQALYNSLAADSDNNILLAYADSALGKIVVRKYTPAVPSVVTVTVSGNKAATITAKNDYIFVSATISPNINTDFTWSITDGEGLASIDMYGKVTAMANGEVTVRATASNGAYGELKITITGQVTGYCDAYFINGCSEAAIANFTTTGAVVNINNTSSGCANDKGLSGYSDFTAKVAEATLGSTLTFKLNYTSNTAYLSAWIDWNQDFIFDDSEKIYASANAESQTGFQFTVTVPATATLGQTRIRLKAVNGWEGSGACGYNSFGEVEDYTINVVPAKPTVVVATQNNVAATITTNKGTLQLGATVTNSTNTAVTWSIPTGTTFATVSATGLVTATANGTATVRAALTSDATVYDDIDVVITNQTIAVTGVTLLVKDNAPATITTNGGILALVAIIAPADATNTSVTWVITEGSEYASIDENGVITAIGNGTIVVTVTSADGSFTDTITIVITGQIIAVKSITVSVKDNADAIITKKEGTLQLVATIAPADATTTEVTWAITEGEEFASIDENGVVTAIANGTITVTATTIDGAYTDTIEIVIKIENTAGIDNITANNFSVYPNPTTGSVTISATHNVNVFTVYNTLGQLVKTGKGNTVNLENAQQGVYMLQVQLENGSTKTLKVIKK